MVDNQSIDLQSLVDYLSNIGCSILETNKDFLYKEIIRNDNYAVLKTFATDKNTKLLCINKTDNEVIRTEASDQTISSDVSTEKTSEIFLETELKFRGQKVSTVCFIKKDSITLENLQDKSLPTLIQVFNFSSEGSEMMIFSLLQNYIQNAFSPLFQSYQSAVGGLSQEQNKSSLKIENFNNVQTKMSELLILLSQSQKNSDIPDIQIEIDPEIKARIAELKAKGKENITVDDFLDKISDTDGFLFRLQNLVLKWTSEISNLTKKNREVNEGTVIQEVNFWKSMESCLNNVKREVNSPEVVLTIGILKHARKFLVTKSFEEETQLDQTITKINSYSSLLKDLPIASLSNSKSISHISNVLKKIFEYLRTKIRGSTYPTQRTYNLVEVLSKDISQYLIEILSSMKLLTLEYDDFKKVFEELEFFFDTWTKEYKQLRETITIMQRTRGERYSTPPNKFEHDNIDKRMKEFEKFRYEHENLKELTQNLLNIESENSDTNLVKDLDFAYSIVLNINILDLSREGETSWTAVRNDYNKRTEKIESKISNFLREKLATAGNPNEQFRIFSKFNKLVSRPRIQAAIQEFQASLVSSIYESLKSLKEKIYAGYSRVSASSMSKIRGIPETSGHVIWLKQFSRKLENYRDRMKMVLGDNWEAQNEGKNVKDIIDHLTKQISQSNKIVENWNKEIHSIENFNNEKILEIVSKRDKYELRVNFDEKIIDLFKEVRLLNNMGSYAVNAYISNKAKDIKNTYPIAISLQDSIRAFNQTCSKIDNRISKLVANTKKEILDLIANNIHFSWSASLKVDRFNKELCEKVSYFEEMVRDLFSKVEQIQIFLNQIASSDLNKDSIQDKISGIQKIVDEIVEPSNLHIWINEMDQKLESILVKKLEDIINIWIKEFTNFSSIENPTLIKEPSVHRIKLKEQMIYLEPGIQDLREYWYNQFHQCIALVCSSKRLEYRLESNLNKDITFKETTYRSIVKLLPNNILKNCYEILEKTIEACEEDVKTWLTYQVLWDIQPKSIFDKLGDDMEKWQQLMNELRSGRKAFDKESEKQFGAIIIDYSMAQTKINNKYDSWHKEIMNKFSTTLNDNIKTFFTLIFNSRTNLESSSLDNSATDIVSFITEIKETEKNLKAWQCDMDRYKNGKKILDKQRYHFPHDFCNIDQLESEWSKFKQILSKKTKQMSEQIPAIQARVGADSNFINKKIQELETYWEKSKPFKADSPLDALNSLSIAENQLKAVKEDFIKNCRAKEMLGMEFEDPNKLDQLEEDVRDLKEVWSSLHTVWAKIDRFRETPFIAIIPEKIKIELNNAIEEMNLFPNKLRNYEAFDIIKNKINNLKKINNIISDLRTDAIKERHWKVILNRLQIRKGMNEIILGDLWNSDLTRHEKFLRDIINNATGELVLETFLKNSKEFWSTFELEMVRYKDKCKLIKGWDDMFTKLDEHINSFVSMQNSPFFGSFKDEIEPWKDKLEKIRILFNEWIDVQRRWVYLEGIFFGSADIMNELASDYNKFKNIDNEFTSLMKKVSSKPLILEVISIPSIKSILEEKLKSSLERIQKSLYNFLEKQRQSFARFYFIGDEDLLEIIGNSKDLVKIQRHFNKMFAGLQGLTAEDGNEITHMSSRENETVKLEKTIKISEDPVVYSWLSKVEDQMRFTLATLLEKSVNEISAMDYINKTDDFVAWIEKYPAQIVVLSCQVLWSASIESALMKKNLLPTLPDNFTLADEEKVIGSQLSALSDQVLKEIPVDMRKKLEQMITELVHERDVVRILQSRKVDNPNNFDWLYYMRFYFNPKTPETLKKLQIKMSNAPFDYGFEYLGVAEKLIQTPLTDRCYLTLTQALYFRMGGSPFGPAGTGKTESVKALGGQLGRFVLIFNCDETFDFKAMGRIFVGLCQVGAWGCFDEFNRLEERILSAVSQQILIIQTGLKEQVSQIDLMGNTIKLNHSMGIFVTMNPGYAGRSQLPDNLKQLFREMAMVKPDKDMIAQVTLFSQGYKTAERLSSKMVSLFDLCSNQLSSQSHYDFGLRALKSVLVNAGNLKRREDKVKKENVVIESWEQKILLQSVCDTLVPKLVAEDILLFNSLLIGVFPDANVGNVQEDALKAKILELCKKRNLQATDKFVDKVIQLYQIQKMNHGVMMVGSSGTGKSCAWKILLEAMFLVDGVKGESYIIDPKALNKDNLYGKLDQTTLDWTDGVFTGTLRRILDNQRGESTKRHWIIFDGNVDPDWAENLNSVLDDNKLLTLPHGDRLSLPPNVRIMFEVENLKNATLATVSRCGMVWFSDDIITTDMIFYHYLNRLSQNSYDDSMNYSTSAKGESKEFDKAENDYATKTRLQCVEAIRYLFKQGAFVSQAIDAASKLIHIMEFTKIRVIESMFALIRKGISNVLEYNENHSEFPMNDNQLSNYLTKWVVFSLIWGHGGSLNLDQRIEFCSRLYSINKGDVDLPGESQGMSLIDYEVKIGDNQWSPWKKKVPNTDIESNKVSDADIVINTVDTVRHQEVLVSWLSEHRPFILCGPPGSGKTMTLMATLKVLTDFEMVFINFSSSTTPELLLKTFDHYCEYKKLPYGTVLRPKQSNKWLVVFCDEINLPEIDKYGTQVVITFLRQMTEQNGFWRPSDKTWVSIERIQFVGACNPPTDVGRHPLNNRFLRHCPLLYVDFPGPESLKQIYGTFNRAILRKVPILKQYGDLLTEAMVEFYTRCQKHYTPDVQAHYIYSPRELTRWKHAINESIESMNSVEDLVRLWAHEALRLFQDRLVLQEEKEWCDKLVDEVSSKHFNNLDPKALERPILFTNLISQKYISCSKDELIKNIEGKLKNFYEEELNVPLVIFDSVLEHILRIDRVLKQPIGHLLLVGMSGVGKTTLSRFVAWMNNLTVFQIKAGRNYSVNDFDEDLRSIMKRAGCKGEKVCFIFDESNVLGPAFLERMNALLASGEVPGLYEGEEYMALINSAKEHLMKENKVLDGEEEIYKQFIKNVQRNLHVVFTMNPLSPDFSNRAASSPALYNRCVIDWFGDWTKDGLWQVANKLTEFVELKSECFGKKKKNENLDNDMMHNLIVETLTGCHMTVKDLNERNKKNGKKFNYITPRDFIDYIKHFMNLQKEKSDELFEQQVHINKGLQKIIETEETVRELKGSLNLKQVELTKKQEETTLKFNKILVDQEEARKKKELAELKKKEIEVMQVEIDKRTEKVKKELSEVIPKMEQAKAAVTGLKATDLAQIRAYKAPPPSVKPCLLAIAVLYGKLTKDPGDAETMKLVKKDDFINVIKNFKESDISDNTRKYLKTILDSPEWDYDKINRGSTIAGMLSLWVTAMLEYSDITGSMQPLQNEIKGLGESKENLENDFKQIQLDISNLEKSIENLKKIYEESVIESNRIKNSIEEVLNKVQRSEKLLENLSGEKNRWSEQMNDFQNQMNHLLGDTLISSSFLTYIGFYDAQYRKHLKASWRETLQKNSILFSESLDEVKWLTKPNDTVIWQRCNLPTDDICLENATILQKFNRYPLIIDPAGQATDFLKKFFESKKLNLTSFTDNNFLKTLESALRFGYPLLVQDVEKIDPIMNSLLNKEIHKTGGRYLIRIGDQEIDFSQTFNMFMVTRDPSCSFTPDLCSRVTFLNFTITPSSLQNQILSLVLKSERPDIDKRKEDLIKAQREFKVQLRELEDSLLQALSSEGSILENDKIMTRLEEIKNKSILINNEVSKTEEVMRELELVTNEYLPISNMASRIFFALDSLNLIHYMYQFSLSFFMGILNYVINSPELEKIPKNNYIARQECIVKELFVEIYHRVSFSLLNKDQVVFALRLAQIRLGNKFKEEIEILLKSNSSLILDSSSVPEKILGGKLNPNQRRALESLSKTNIYGNLVGEIMSEPEKWMTFFTETNAENFIPLDFARDYLNSQMETDKLLLEELVKMTVLNVLRPDRMLNSGKAFIKNLFGEKFVNIPELDLIKIIDHQSHPKSPILFCSAPGHDASSKIESLAKRLNRKYMAIAIGSSEGFELVEKNFINKMRAGEWLILKNVHLAPSWLNELEKKLYSNEPDSKFRLFLTMEFNPKVPSNVLRISRKFIFELPAGIRYSMIRSYNSVLNPAKSERNPVERCKLHFLIAWFHAVISERLRYTPIGWSKAYEFNEADQRCALDAVDEWIDIFGKDKNNIDPNKIPWDAIRTIIAQSMYGGKIDNEYDHKILLSLVQHYFNEKTFNLNYPLFKAAVGSNNQMLYIPECRNNQSYIDWINQLPTVESPEWSGLPNNAEKLLRENQSRKFLEEINKIQGLGDDEIGEATDSKAKAKSWLSVVEEKSKKIYEILPKEMVSLDKGEIANRNPIFRFLKRESVVASGLLKRVKSDISKLIEMCKGTSKSTNDLREIALQIFNDDIPKQWKVYNTVDLNVTEFIIDLKNRINQLNHVASKPDFGKSGMWLGGLIFSEAYLTATRQYVAQNLKVSLDELKLNILFDTKNLEDNDFVISGLSIEGADWSYNEKKLIMTDNLSFQLPDVVFRWSKKINIDDNEFYIPVYLNSSRKNLLFSVLIKNDSELTDSDWYQRGTSFISWNKVYEFKPK